MIYTYNETYQILNESSEAKLIQTDKNIIVNYFKGNKPQGFIIEDTYNNIKFPIKKPRLDTNKAELPVVYRQFQAKYSKFKLDNLPWHFVVENIDGIYVAFNTRPILLKYPFTNSELKIDLNIDVSQCIHIAIIGDTDSDVYTTKCYELIGRKCIAPFLKIMRKSGSINRNILPLNIGSKFNIKILENFIKK